MGTIRYNKSDMTVEGGAKTEDAAKLIQMGWVDSPEIGISVGHDTDNPPAGERLVLDGGSMRVATQDEIDAYPANRRADSLTQDKRGSKAGMEDRLIDLAIIRASHKRMKAIEDWLAGGMVGPAPRMSGSQWKQSIKDEIEQS